MNRLMRFHYTKEELIQLYERLVYKALRFVNYGNIDKALTCIFSAADFQYHFNFRYSDDRLNNIIKQISFSLHKEDNYVPNSEVVFFYDSFGLDNRGLTQQYLDALAHCRKYNVIYILEHYVSERGNDIIKFCQENDIMVKYLPESSWRDRDSFLYNLIRYYKPSAALFHLTPNTFIPFLSFYPFSGIKKYQLNLTDHAFWLGASDFFNYSYEFRPYGMSVSMQKRGFDPGQLILNSYYPWNSGEPFKGFPINTEDKVVLFSGGAPYKIEGDNGKFYEIVRTILTNNPKVLFLYAGGGDMTNLNSFILENKFEKRMFLLGDRSDINSVFENIDIYLNTYPFGGGLMVQYAAINSKPILMYKCKDLEDIICTKKKGRISIDSLNVFYQEANKLIEDADYRKKKGCYYRGLIADQEDFRERFEMTFLKLCESVYYEEQTIDYDEFCISCLQKINNNVFGFVEKSFVKNGIFSLKVILNLIMCIPDIIIGRIKSGLFK